VYLNNTQISASDNSYGFRSYLETLLTYGADAKKGHLTAALWEADTPGKFDVADPYAVADANDGLKKRAKYTETSKILDLFGRPHADIFRQDRLLLNGVDLRLKLSRQRDAFALMSSIAASTCKIAVKHASFFVRKVRPASSVLLAHTQALARSNAKYPLQRVELKTFTITQGSLQGHLDNVVLGK